MVDPIIVKMLYGLIAMTIVGPIFLIAGRWFLDKKKDEMTSSTALGVLLYVIFALVWYVGLFWYWFTLLGEATA